MPPDWRWLSARTVYDCMYLALAQRLGARLITADRRFADAVARTDHADLVVALNELPGDGPQELTVGKRFLHLAWTSLLTSEMPEHSVNRFVALPQTSERQ